MEQINQKKFNEKLNSENLVLVDFFTTWCGPCKMMAPILEKVSKQITNVSFYKIDMEEETKLKEEYSISVVPTIILFKDGKNIASFSGFKPESQVIDFIKTSFNI